MFRKENRNPNKSENICNKSKYHRKEPASTPDENTSRVNYKPKFIKKFVNMEFGQQMNLSCTPQSSQPSETYTHSPTSITEQNTIGIESLGMRNKWKDLYYQNKLEMEARTQKFDKSIGTFCFILKDLRSMIRDPDQSADDKLMMVDDRIRNLLLALQQFQSDS